MPIVALCGDQESSGVIWTRRGQTHYLYLSYIDWGNWKYERSGEEDETELPQILAATGPTELPAPAEVLPGACGRPGFLSMYWAGEGQIHIKHWGTHTEWTPVEGVLDPNVAIAPGTPLYAICIA